MIVDVWVKIYFPLRKIVVIVVRSCHLQSQILANRCEEEKNCLKLEGCNFPRCSYSLPPGTLSENVTSQPLIACISCQKGCHVNCKELEVTHYLDNVIGDHFADHTKLCYYCCLKFFEYKSHSSTGLPQRTFVCKRIYATTRRTVSFDNIVWYIINALLFVLLII